jgi:hypothetical protein
MSLRDVEFWGLRLYNAGFNVIPVNEEKRPFCSWSSEKRIKEEEFRRLLSKASGIGIAAGPIHPFGEKYDLLIVDVDKPSFLKRTPFLEYKITQTVHWKSGPRCPKCKAKKVDKEIEVLERGKRFKCKKCNIEFALEEAERGLGAIFLIDRGALTGSMRKGEVEFLIRNYQVIPPSIHPTGVYYEYIRPVDFTEKNYGIVYLDANELRAILGECTYAELQPEVDLKPGKVEKEAEVKSQVSQKILIEENKAQVFHAVRPKKCPYCRKYHTIDCPAETKDSIKMGVFFQNEDSEPVRDDCFEPDPENMGKAKLKVQPVVLEHLNLVEDPKLAGHPVIVDAVISSTSVAYLAPVKIEASVRGKDGFTQILEREIEPDDPINVQLISTNEGIKYKRLKRFLGLSTHADILEKSFRTIYKLRVRPPVFTLEKRGDKIVDEYGFEYKAFDIYVASDKPIVFRPSSLIRIEGIPIPNPKTQQTTILAYKVDFPEESINFDREKLNILKEKFKGMTVSQRVKWILDNFEKFSKIVGRRNLAFAGLLTYFTPLRIKLNGEIQRGWANTLFCGDTTTAKTETVRKLIMLLKGGMLITAETASIVGLTGTATQLEREGWFVDWGFLVLLDGKLLAVDGAHKLSQSNWAALAEAERNGIVTIAKAAKNTAYARTRQIKIANPVDKEANRYSTKSLSEFPYSCQALPTILDKTSIARLDLAVFADQRDVSPEEINKQMIEEPEQELFLLSEALKWCWSGVAQIEFTSEAIERILKEATELYKTFFYEDIPLCSIDMKWKLAQLSASLAFLTLSTEDFNKVVVMKEHVEEVVRFIKEEYSRAGLNILAQTEKSGALTIEDVIEIFNKIEAQLSNALDLGKICEILRYIVLKGPEKRVTREEIWRLFNLSENKELRPLLAILSSEELIKTKRGIHPTSKLIQAYNVTDGFNSIKLINFINAKKEGMQNFFGIKKETPLHSNIDKLDKLDGTNDNSN